MQSLAVTAVIVLLLAIVGGPATLLLTRVSIRGRTLFILHRIFTTILGIFSILMGFTLLIAHVSVIVPGFGLAVAQAQHTVRELADLLSAKGIDVAYGIHPVAGRMPGHMNVLLAEANVPYEQLVEMEEVNPTFPQTDVVLVVGANDVVNPAAKTTPGCPIYGMPILDVSQAGNVIFLKRSMRPGFAGIENELLYDAKTTLLFGDAKDSLTKVVSALKAL